MTSAGREPPGAMRKLRLWATIIVVALGVIGIGLLALVANKPQSHLVAEATAPSSTQAGEYLQRLGDCVACHSVPDGAPFAGGLEMGTPLGSIYSTNITPDRETGIGLYTLADFDNAVRRGVARDGHRLYPVMPYPSYTKLTDGDVRKLYDYFMHAVQPAHQPNHPAEIPFPLNLRWPLAVWNAVFLDRASYHPKPEHDAVWNRGAYIVQSLGHCGSCHTPRGPAFNEVALDESSESYVGGALLDGWYASNLRGDPVIGLGRWSEQDIVRFLETGHNAHATVFGSMLDAFNNGTQFMSTEDLVAVARYLKSLPARGSVARPPFVYDNRTLLALDAGNFSVPGAGLYLNECSTCHGRDGNGHGDLLPPLAGNVSVLEDDPSSLINILLNGAGRLVVNGVPDSYRMTPFRVLLSDQEIADVATFIRSGWGNRAPAVTADQVKALRAATDPASDHVIVLKLR
jgi:mono/diheme cytochrome c family protein